MRALSYVAFAAWLLPLGHYGAQMPTAVGVSVLIGFAASGWVAYRQTGWGE